MENLKNRYAARWGIGSKKEAVFECLVTNLTPFRVVRSGVGTGARERVEGFHRNPGEKFDYTLFFGDKVVAYVDITGSDRYPPWVQTSKLFYAEKYGVIDLLWIGWLDMRKGMFFFIYGPRALKEEGELISLPGEPNPYKAIPLRKWIPWIKWIDIMIKRATVV